jgi:hypothetical protein
VGLGRRGCPALRRSKSRSRCLRRCWRVGQGFLGGRGRRGSEGVGGCGGWRGGCGREGGEAGTWWAGVLLAVALWGAKDEVFGRTCCGWSGSGGDSRLMPRPGSPLSMDEEAARTPRPPLPLPQPFHGFLPRKLEPAPRFRLPFRPADSLAAFAFTGFLSASPTPRVPAAWTRWRP